MLVRVDPDATSSLPIVTLITFARVSSFDAKPLIALKQLVKANTVLRRSRLWLEF